MLTVLSSALPAALGTGDSIDRGIIKPCGDPNAEAPALKASSAILYSIDLDKAVYEKNADEKMPPYSITKLLTCYLALENLDPEQVVTASKNATKELEDGMELELEPGEKLKAIDLIYASMLMSANDGATALGEAVSGSEKEFIALMNKTVEEWGCKNTHFVNANGWEHKNHYTTARDMAIITKNCLANDKLREISMTKKYTVPASNMSDPLKIENGFLKTMDNYKVLTGGKTGSWSETQCTIALEFADEGINAVIVLLGDTKKGREQDPRKIVEFAHDVTPGFVVTDSNKAVCEAWVKGGSKVKVPLDIKGLRYAYPANGKASGIRIKTEVDKLKAPLKKGDTAGKYYIYANDQEVGKGRLYVGEDIEKGWFPSALYISNRKSLALLIALVLILLLGFILEKNKKKVLLSHAD
ncbi:MAG: D-alanyl-D-alanine carboxypeptidase [Mogibacterium sp.]|nr:D-alanyl-D-alanine carboxypeptidase [Mogibacterium sp.]